MPRKKRPVWLKPLILSLIVFTIIGLVGSYLLNLYLENKNRNSPSLQETDSEIQQQDDE